MSTTRPILFSAPMVRAILAEVANPGHGKTKTRRLARFIPRDDYTGNLLFSGIAADKVSEGVWALVSRGAGGCWNERTKPLRTFAVGDRLWVRETWAVGKCGDDLSPSCLSRGFWMHDNGGVWCAAGGDPAHPISPRGKWRPGIHMPRWASRLTLEVTAVRIERLQDITEDDAKAEGADRLVMDDECRFYLDAEKGTHRCGFAGLWNHINGKRHGADWDANPWVVAITFTPHLVNVDAPAAQRAKETA